MAAFGEKNCHKAMNEQNAENRRN